MEKIFFLILLLSNFSLFSQDFKNNNLLYLKCNSTVYRVKKIPPVFKKKIFFNNSEQYNFKFYKNPQKCKPGMMLFFAPLVGIATSYASYTSFKEGYKNEGYVTAGFSAFLIIAPISYILYCRKHGWH